MHFKLKLLLESVHSFLSNDANRPTDRQTSKKRVISYLGRGLPSLGDFLVYLFISCFLFYFIFNDLFLLLGVISSNHSLKDLTFVY